MLQPPPLKNIPHYPVTAGLALGAIVVSVLAWSGTNIEPFVATSAIWRKWELWRAFTSTLPHGSFFHLAFNAYWLWVFGTLLEDVYGHVRFAGIVLLLALGSSLGEFIFLHGGIGLSGVGYGLFGMLWVLARREPRFAGAVDANTVRLFVIWFFVCIGLTLSQLMPIANIAHGVGALLGALLGFAVSDSGKAKRLSIAALIALMTVLLLGSMVFWPDLNRTSSATDALEQAGVDALVAKDNEKGRAFLERCVKRKDAQASAWYNLGVAYERSHALDQALAAFEHAADMPDATPDMRAAARNMELMRAAEQGGRH